MASSSSTPFPAFQDSDFDDFMTFSGSESDFSSAQSPCLSSKPAGGAGLVPRQVSDLDKCIVGLDAKAATSSNPSSSPSSAPTADTNVEACGPDFQADTDLEDLDFLNDIPDFQVDTELDTGFDFLNDTSFDDTSNGHFSTSTQTIHPGGQLSPLQTVDPSNLILEPSSNADPYKPSEQRQPTAGDPSRSPPGAFNGSPILQIPPSTQAPTLQVFSPTTSSPSLMLYPPMGPFIQTPQGWLLPYAYAGPASSMQPSDLGYLQADTRAPTASPPRPQHDLAIYQPSQQVPQKYCKIKSKLQVITNPKTSYSQLLGVPSSWDDFSYGQKGELEPGRIFTTLEIQKYLFHHPIHDSTTGALSLWIQRSPACPASSYPSDKSNICRFVNCPVQDRRISPGQLRVAFDEYGHCFKNFDPFHNAAYVHLCCLEHFLSFPTICKRLNIKPENRERPHEPQGINLMALSKSHVKATESFIQDCTNSLIPAGYPHPQDKPWNYQRTLSFILSDPGFQGDGQPYLAPVTAMPIEARRSEKRRRESSYEEERLQRMQPKRAKGGSQSEGKGGSQSEEPKTSSTRPSKLISRIKVSSPLFVSAS